jgi:hypothetical protein
MVLIRQLGCGKEPGLTKFYMKCVSIEKISGNEVDYTA